MGIEKYLVAPNTFEQYYDIFLQNSFEGEKYKITPVSGESLTGILTAGASINPMGPNASFDFRSEDGNTYRLPFSELRNATPLK